MPYPAPPVEATAVEFTREIAAGEKETFNHGGTFLRIRSANRSFNIRLGAKAPFRMGAGAQYSSPPGVAFPFVVIENTSADLLVITLVIGQGLITSDASPQIEHATQFVANAAVSIPATSGISLPGTPTAVLNQRRAVFVSNLDPNLSIQLRDQAGNVGLTIFKESSVVVEVSGFVQVYNPNPGAVAVSISESWFINE